MDRTGRAQDEKQKKHRHTPPAHTHTHTLRAAEKNEPAAYQCRSAVSQLAGESRTQKHPDRLMKNGDWLPFSLRPALGTPKQPGKRLPVPGLRIPANATTRRRPFHTFGVRRPIRTTFPGFRLFGGSPRRRRQNQGQVIQFDWERGDHGWPSRSN